jgi:hypothetical protein
VVEQLDVAVPDQILGCPSILCRRCPVLHDTRVCACEARKSCSTGPTPVGRLGFGEPVLARS